MTDRDEKAGSDLADMLDIEARRTFLRGLGKWSQAVIGGVLLGGALTESERANAWVAAGGYRGSVAAGRRGSWVNRYGGGGWINRSGGWADQGGSWINRGGGWTNRGGSWINRGGGSGGWINRYGGGGGSWINRY